MLKTTSFAMAGSLMISISGIRGIFGESLQPPVIIKYATAFGTWCARRAKASGARPVVVVGRDGRVTGQLCARLVKAALQSTGCDVVYCGMATTPTVEMAVIAEKAQGGIILSASHNPAQWNALKLLNEKGEFLSAEEGAEVLGIADREAFDYAGYDAIGNVRDKDYLGYHIEQILKLPFIEPNKIAGRNFRVVVDGVNSVGGVAVPALLKQLGLKHENILCLNCEPTGRFAHTPEPLPENLTEMIRYVAEKGADLGIVVDPDADRLAFIEDGGTYLSEELTQVLAADFMWRFRPGPFATNLSSSRAIEDVAARYGNKVYRSAVGEINVVKKMQEMGAVLGGEGNGGVILPELHYGRDALVGVAMILQHLANEGRSLSQMRAGLPVYRIAKHKTEIGDLDPDKILARMAERHASEQISTIDGLKIDLESGWVHLRKSNTEPIIRVYAEARTTEEADGLAKRFMEELKAVGQ